MTPEEQLYAETLGKIESYPGFAADGTPEVYVPTLRPRCPFKWKNDPSAPLAGLSKPEGFKRKVAGLIFMHCYFQGGKIEAQVFQEFERRAAPDVVAAQAGVQKIQAFLRSCGLQRDRTGRILADLDVVEQAVKGILSKQLKEELPPRLAQQSLIAGLGILFVNYTNLSQANIVLHIAGLLKLFDLPVPAKENIERAIQPGRLNQKRAEAKADLIYGRPDEQQRAKAGIAVRLAVIDELKRREEQPKKKRTKK